ncbi:MAG TPA: phospho-N-acetylmuramoyl-pentapeptide-transferase [Bacillota bacterium]|nr:phospho-N-acetylmuramoyl-pentapeptide-transferase [Bacillota bacterium]
MLAATASAALLGWLLIPALRRLRIGQQIRSDGPARHLVKAGTPTMGGVLVLGGMAVGWLVSGASGPRLALAFAVTAAYGLLGFIDDYSKVVLRRSLGLKARHKLAYQFAVGLAMGLAALQLPGHGTTVRLPFVELGLDLGWTYPAFVGLLAASTSNSVNLADGVDGLAAGLMVIAMAAYSLLAWILGAGDLLVFCLVTVGGCLGFLVHNWHPARVFMGDTGSLALGGALASAAVLTRTELVLPVIAGVFVVETLSVMLQVTAFRLTGRRIIRMCPLHHHFELVGWSERKVVLVFWAAGLAFAALALLGMAWGAPR